MRKINNLFRKKMGIIVNKENDNDNLSRRINADLKEKMDTKPNISSEDADPDFIDDSDYTRDLKKTGKFGWVWIVLIVLAIISLIAIVNI